MSQVLLSVVPLVLLASCDNKAALPLSGVVGHPDKENSEGPVLSKEHLSQAPPEASVGEEPRLPLIWPCSSDFHSLGDSARDCTGDILEMEQ